MKRNLKNYLLLLDRDGCLNEIPKNSKYVSNMEQLRINIDAISFLKSIKSTGLNLAVVTNQQGISKGIYSKELVESIHDYIESIAGFEKGSIGLFYCPHIANTCSCRKPSPLMLLQAMSHYGVTPERTFFLGDTDTDAQAASQCDITFFAYNFWPSIKSTKNIRICNFSEIEMEIEKIVGC
jgi:D-glycero-D-manno-heptose 1,7-bisphosphate phosphatase